MNATLSRIKNRIDADSYELLLRYLDDYHNEVDRLTILSRKAELNCLNKNKFDITDYLKGEELAEYMELDNADKIAFGMTPEWSKEFIKHTKSGIDEFNIQTNDINPRTNTRDHKPT